jgi:fluoroquinolone transport system permease protein
MRRVVALLRADAANVVRDPLLAIVPFVPLFLWLGMRLVLPPAAAALAPVVDLPRYYPTISAFLLLMTPLMIGMVAGFLLLDERDESVLMSIAVTTVGKGRFLAYRLLVPTIAGFGLDLLLAGPLAPLPAPLAAVFLPAAVASLEAPLMALYLAVFAANKVEGLVLVKAASILDLAPLAPLFVPMPWQLLAGVMPGYWVARSLLVAGESAADHLLSGGVGLLYHAVLLALLARRFRRLAG